MHPPGRNTGMGARTVEVPNQTDIPQFVRWVWPSFQMPKVRCHAEKMENDYLAPPGPHNIKRDAFLPFSTVKCGSLDYHVKQPHKTLAYSKALQFWAEKAQPPMPDQPCQLAECVWELKEAMGPLTTFTDEEVLSNDAPLHWVKITSSRIFKPAEPASSQE